jgi:geranylgeranyl diphosphate synthase type I
MDGAGEVFAAYLARNLRRIEACVLERCPQAPQASRQKAALDQYLYDPVRRFVASGGKRIRPALCLLGAEAVGACSDVALPAAAAVELFQAAALIHDDIADRSELRRGVPCLHITEGVGLAINAGDSALVSVVSTVLRDPALDPSTRMRLLEELCTMEERTLDGQALDLGWARDARWDISVDDYLQMARAKTAFYSAAIPLAMGAICGSGSSEQINGLRRFGMDCGLAFQIQDDLLNLIGNPNEQGKDYRSDITEGKRTLVMVWALAHLDAAGRDELVGILSSATHDARELDRAVGLAAEAGAIDHAKTFAQGLVERAQSDLDHLPIAEDSRGVLRSMADYFVKRIN